MIRSTGQSLLDYVPEGPTREGYAGTYATENFRLMRAALDETSKELGRYIRLTNYASGLCMPEIATLAGLERLDMMLNDSMYGILFRDINPVRTFVDQRFSRQIHARPASSSTPARTTTSPPPTRSRPPTRSPSASCSTSTSPRRPVWRTGSSGSATRSRSTPTCPTASGWSAHALLARQLFPDAPLKWMPPTKHMTGDVFRGYLLDGFFNLVGAMTGQGILLVGMMTEAVVTPSDQDLALQNVRYVMNAAGGLTEDFHPPRDGFIQTRARRCSRRRSGCSTPSSTTATPRGTRAPRGHRRRDLRAHEAARSRG